MKLIILVGAVFVISACHSDQPGNVNINIADSTSNVHVSITTNDSIADSAHHKTINIDPNSADIHISNKGVHIEATGDNKEKVSVHIDEKGVDIKTKEGVKQEKK